MVRERTRRVRCLQCRRYWETRRVFGQYCSVKCRVAAFRRRERELTMLLESETRVREVAEDVGMKLLQRVRRLEKKQSAEQK